MTKSYPLGWLVLELYQAEGWPYSAQVREKLIELGVSAVIHNPRSAERVQRNEQTHRNSWTSAGTTRSRQGMVAYTTTCRR